MKITNESRFALASTVANLGGGDAGVEGETPAPDCCDTSGSNSIDRAADVGVTTIFRDPTDSGALTLVQDATQAAGLGGHVTVTLPGTATAGNLLVAAFSIRSGGDPSALSITPGTWTLITKVDSTGGNSGDALMWYKEADGTETAVDIQGIANYDRATVMEFAGIGTLVDFSVVDDSTASGTTTAVPAVTVTETVSVLVGIAHQSREPSTLNAVELTEVDQGKAGGTFGPTSIVGYLNPGAAGDYDWNPTSNQSDTWAAILAAFQIATAGSWVNGGEEMADADDATYYEVDGANIVRIDLGAPFPINGVRLLVGPATSGSKTYTLKADDDPEFGSPVTVATLAITAAGAYATSDVSAVFASQTYQYWELTGPAEVARFFSLELLQGATPSNLTLDDLLDVNAPSPTDGQVLTYDSATGMWVPDTGGGISYAGTGDIADVAATESAGAATTVPRGDHVHRLGITTTRGDLIRRGATDNERVALGASGYNLVSDGTDAVWAASYGGIEGFVYMTDVGSDACWVRVPWAATIVEATIIGDVSGSAVVDIKKRAFGGGAASSICAAAKPTLSSAQESTDTTLTGWTTSLSAGDILYFHPDSATTVAKCNVSLKVRKT